jgi:hypothetical protein
LISHRKRRSFTHKFALISDPSSNASVSRVERSQRAQKREEILRYPSAVSLGLDVGVKQYGRNGGLKGKQSFEFEGWLMTNLERLLTIVRKMTGSGGEANRR